VLTLQQVTDTQIRAVWQCLLNREPAESELSAQRRFHTEDADPFARFAEEVLRSPEFANRFRRVGARHIGADDVDLSGSKLVFIHIEKCGGTTLHKMLRTQFPDIEICPERFDGLGDFTINELSRFRLFSGHFDFAYSQFIPGDVQVITMFREPRSRLISLYEFWRAHRFPTNNPLAELAKQHDAETFFNLPVVLNHPSTRDAMAGQLLRKGRKSIVDVSNILRSSPEVALGKAISIVRQMAAFGLVEDMEASRRIFNKTLGLKMDAVEPQQVLSQLTRTDRSLRRLPPCDMTDGLRHALDRLVQIDTALYKEASAIFGERVAALQGA